MTRRQPKPPSLPSESETLFQARVLELARLAGWTHIYHTRDSRGSTAGFPDLCLCRPGRLLFAELKTEKGKLSAAQQSWIDALRSIGAVGIEVYLWRPSDWDRLVRILTQDPGAGISRVQALP